MPRSTRPFQSYRDAALFLADAEPFLQREEARNNVLYGLARAYASGGLAAPEKLYFALARKAGEVVACALHTPPMKALVTGGWAALEQGGDGDLLDAFIADLRAAQPDLLGLGGPDEDARAVATRWMGGKPPRPVWEQGIYQLTEVIPPSRPAPGRMRLAEADDEALVVEWMHAFADAIAGVMLFDPDAVARYLMAAKGFYLWVVDERPVSMAAMNGWTPHCARVSYVYTPDAERGHGYATLLTAELTREILAQGAHSVVLYTDLDNPTSNSIYRKIGYRMIGRGEDFAFK